MATIDGLIFMKININHLQMPAVNISKNQPRKAKGLGGVFPLRSKSAALLYMYKLNTPFFARGSSIRYTFGALEWLLSFVSPFNESFK